MILPENDSRNSFSSEGNDFERRLREAGYNVKEEKAYQVWNIHNPRSVICVTIESLRWMFNANPRGEREEEVSGYEDPCETAKSILADPLAYLQKIVLESKIIHTTARRFVSSGGITSNEAKTIVDTALEHLGHKREDLDRMASSGQELMSLTQAVVEALKGLSPNKKSDGETLRRMEARKELARKFLHLPLDQRLN
jgi:hypothetical protein